MDIRPDELALRDRYKLLIGAIVPRPIAVVSTLSAAGETNLAPFSFFCGVGASPMTLAFCPGNKADGSEKDTL
ncbi:MAG: flavin reductase, partial [Acidobacteria bacterium]|nr:flavin reductase [Acidobacteriota bacterium]